MVQRPVVSEADTRDAFVATPLDDYELIDFGAGRKLERWGGFLVASPDRLARGAPAHRHWNADWIYVDEVGRQGHWEPARSGLPGEWALSVDGRRVLCRLDPRGRLGLHGRDVSCARWVCRRIEGCYDIEDIRVLNLFGANGYVSAQALAAGASVGMSTPAGSSWRSPASTRGPATSTTCRTTSWTMSSTCCAARRASRW